MPAQRPIYLDHNATTPCDERVVEAMRPFWSEVFGNPASRTHAWGWRAGEAVEEARAGVARAIGADSREIVFTSGATESNNLAIQGLLRAAGTGGHLVTCATEHNAVLDPCTALERAGVAVTRLPVDREGRIDADDLRKALRPDTRLVSLMHANNEIGTLHDLAELTAVAHAASVPFHTDAAQSVGKIPVDVNELGVDLLSLTGHKLYGPKGIGALYVRRGRPRLRLEPLLFGGGHERGLRSGTLPVPLCVGLAAAVGFAVAERDAEALRQRELRERLWKRVSSSLDGVWLNGHPEARLPGNLSLSFAGIEGEALVLALDDIGLSTGSACTSARQQASHVLRALGLPAARAQGSLRFGLGRSTTADEIDRAADRVVEQVCRLRALSPRGAGG